MSIADKLQAVKEELPQGVRLIAVSKYHPEEEVMEAYEAGQRDFGENIAQELRRKHGNLPEDIQWHFIGHLQKNKIKYIAPYVSLIHSVDSFELLSEINHHAIKAGRTIPCLLQIHVAKEETKFGFSFDECLQMLDEQQWTQLGNICIAGLMCMASNVPDEKQIHEEFGSVNRFFERLKSDYFQNNEHFSCRSWGMSSDYKIAIEEGSNMVRVGTRIFGPRPYPTLKQT